MKVILMAALWSLASEQGCTSYGYCEPPNPPIEKPLEETQAPPQRQGFPHLPVLPGEYPIKAPPKGYLCTKYGECID